VPSIRVEQAHACAIRLCGLMYAAAFLGNAIDGPVMWTLTPPSGGFSPEGLTWLNRLALAPALVAFLRPRCWPALAACWPLWHTTFVHGGEWFWNGWDEMLDEVGFLATLLGVTLTLYDGTAKEPSGPSGQELAQPILGAEPEAGQPEGPALRTLARHCWAAFWGPGCARPSQRLMEPCHPAVNWSRNAAELALTLMGFRLFLSAGLEKMRVGEHCWHDFTCLRDFYEMQPMPSTASWYLHNYTPHLVMGVMQWFAINLAECVAPFLLLGFLLSMGPLAPVHHRLRKSSSPLVRGAAGFPARLVGSSIIAVFVLGMFFAGNFAFLHPLTLVPLVASTATVRGAPLQLVREPAPGLRGRAKASYRRIAPWLVLVLEVFAFLPSFHAYAWLLRGDESTGSLLAPLMSSQPVLLAEAMNLGVPYQRDEYFANPVHVRNEMVLFADVGEDGWVEVDVPYKVGRPDRAPLQTSPLHRRFAWRWWFLPLGTLGMTSTASDPAWLFTFLQRLCEGDSTMWSAVERSPVHDRLGDVRRVAVQMFNYRFAEPGGEAWWVRTSLGDQAWPRIGRTRVERSCGGPPGE